MGIVRDEFARLQHRYPEAKGWELEISSRLKRAAGVALYDEKIIRLADWLTTRASEAEVLDTLYHEVAHVLAGIEADHGPEWKKWAEELGARPEARYGDDVAELNYINRPLFVWVCSACTHITHRKPAFCVKCKERAFKREKI
jgi:predicted SprT family Zn-dependent metalloprotease